MSRQYSCVRQETMQNISTNESTSWKSKDQGDLYRSKLVQALHHIQLSSSPFSGNAVRQAANRALAMTAKGHTRWSQAILTNKLKRKAKKRFSKRRIGILRLKSLALQRKARDLRHLVPGCRKQPLAVVLEEVTDYIGALEMQVKAMAALADLFSSINQPSSS